MRFAADWLALRAPFDAAARNAALEDRLAAWARDRAPGRALQVVDLGAGSGNNLDHLAPRLRHAQDWTLVDSDAALLADARLAHPTAQTVEADLTGALEPLITPGTDLVTASALIDLVSEAWLARLTSRVREVGSALFVVLSYDGRIVWEDESGADREVRNLVNRHQRTDKGFGPALGPDAALVLDDLLDGVLTADSDWVIAADDSAMRASLLQSWATAATELDPDQAAAIQAWRTQALAAARGLTVGHKDQLWLPERPTVR